MGRHVTQMGVVEVSSLDTSGASAAINTQFVLTSGYLVFVMQAGFALICAAHIRKKNNANILLCNAVDTVLVTLMFYLLGFGFAFGVSPSGNSTPFIGIGNFALEGVTDFTVGEHSYQFFLFHWAFACAATTICAGAVAERMNFLCYVGYAVLMPGFVYPVIVHWTWSQYGWLSASNPTPLFGSGAIDFAGSGVVHLAGGVTSLVACLTLGPRLGRFDTNGKPNDDFKATSATNMFIGTVLLWFGWFGFNTGSVAVLAGAPGAPGIVARVAVCTALAAGSSGVTALLTSHVMSRYWNVTDLCNGILAGTVAVTAGCGVIEPWAALLLGLLSGPLVVGAEWFVIFVRIDDVVAAVATHCVCGVLGTLWVGFFATEDYVLAYYGPGDQGAARWGVFWGGNGMLLACQVIECAVIMAWVGALMGAYFWACRALRVIRVPVEHELAGLDASKYALLTSNTIPTPAVQQQMSDRLRNRVD